MLSKKLIERIRPFVEATKPDDKNDPEVKAYVQRIKTEADDLKLESFGVEVRLLFGHALTVVLKVRIVAPTHHR